MSHWKDYRRIGFHLSPHSHFLQWMQLSTLFSLVYTSKLHLKDSNNWIPNVLWVVWSRSTVPTGIFWGWFNAVSNVFDVACLPAMAMGYLETLLGENCVLTAAWDLAVEHVRTPLRKCLPWTLRSDWKGTQFFSAGIGITISHNYHAFPTKRSCIATTVNFTIWEGDSLQNDTKWRKFLI